MKILTDIFHLDSHTYCLQEFYPRIKSLYLDLVYSCSYEDKVYVDWTKDVGSISQENLDKPLIIRDTNTKLIKVNFDPQVCSSAFVKDFFSNQKKLRYLLIKSCSNKWYVESEKFTIFREEQVPYSVRIGIWRYWFFGGRKTGEPEEKPPEQCEN